MKFKVGDVIKHRMLPEGFGKSKEIYRVNKLHGYYRCLDFTKISFGDEWFYELYGDDYEESNMEEWYEI